MPGAEERRALLAHGHGGRGRGGGLGDRHGIAPDRREQRVHIGHLRRGGDAIRQGERFAAVHVEEGVFADAFHAWTQIDRFQRGAVTEHIAADAAHAVDEHDLPQSGAACEQVVRQVLDGRVADDGFQRVAVLEGVQRDIRVGFGNDEGAHGQLHVEVVAIARAIHHVAADHRQLHAVDLPGQVQIELVAPVAIQAGVFLVIPEIVAGQLGIGHLHQIVGRLAHAGHRRIPGAMGQLAQQPHLLVRGVGRGVDLRMGEAFRQQIFGQDRRVAQHGELGEVLAAVQRALADGGQGGGQGQLGDAGAAPEGARADGGQGFGQGQRCDVRAVAEGLLADGGDGREHLHICHAAVGEGFPADGGEPAAVVGIEGADGLIALEQAVAQGGDRNVVIVRPHGQILLIAVIRLPHAVFDGCDLGLVDRILRHTAAFRVVDPDGAVRALIPEQRGIGVAVLDAAVPGQVKVGNLGVGKCIRRDVNQLMEIKHDVIQRAIGKGTRTDAFHLAAQVQLLAPRALEGALADGSDRGGQHQDAFAAILERPRADFLQALAPVDLADLGVEEGVVADGFQRGGKFDVAQAAGVLERAGFNARQALGEDDAVHGVIAPEGVLADGLHRHAADGRRNLNKGMILLVAGDGASGSVKDEPVLAALRGEEGVFAAGAEMLRRAVGLRQGGGVGVELIVGHIDHIVAAQPVKAPVGVQEERAGALEGDFLQVFTGVERAVHNADAGGNGQAGQRIAVVEIGADVLQAVVERDAGQAVHPGDGPVLDGPQRIRHRQRSDRIVRVKAVVLDGVDRIAIHLRRDDHIPADLAHPLETQVARVIGPGGSLLRPSRAANQAQRQQGQQEQFQVLHDSCPPFPFIHPGTGRCRACPSGPGNIS